MTQPSLPFHALKWPDVNLGPCKCSSLYLVHPISPSYSRQILLVPVSMCFHKSLCLFHQCFQTLLCSSSSLLAPGGQGLCLSCSAWLPTLSSVAGAHSKHLMKEEKDFSSMSKIKCPKAVENSTFLWHLSFGFSTNINIWAQTMLSLKGHIYRALNPL